MFQGGFHKRYFFSVQQSEKKHNELEYSLMYQHENVSILYADLVGFTSLSSKVSVEGLVWLLNSIFSDFDRIMEKESIEKVKTIGDCYVVCAGNSSLESLSSPVTFLWIDFTVAHSLAFVSISGIPKYHPDHAEKIVRSGLEMIKRTTSIETEEGSASLQIRVGIHSGSVTAGLIGLDKLIYGSPFPTLPSSFLCFDLKINKYKDIWGKDVSIAALMEKTSLPSRVHVSEATFVKIRDVCEFEEAEEAKLDNTSPSIPTFLFSDHLFLVFCFLFFVFCFLFF